MISSGVNLVMTLIGFGVSTLFIVFICTRLIFARIQLHASRRRHSAAAAGFAISSRTDLAIMERGLHGLEPVMISNFPTKKYSDEFFSCIKHSQCTVCLSEYHHEDMLRILPNCGHSFHASCIDIWLHQHSTCPICRVSLRGFPEKRRLMQPLFSSAQRYHRGMASYHSPHCILANQSNPSRSHNCPLMNPIQETRCIRQSNPSRSHNCPLMNPIQETRCIREENMADGVQIAPHVNNIRQSSKDTGQEHVESQSSA